MIDTRMLRIFVTCFFVACFMQVFAQEDLRKAIRDVNEKNFETSINVLEKYAKKGNPEAQSKLAVCYLQGNGVKQDYKKGHSLLDKAIKQGYAPAMYNKGITYRIGAGHPVNNEIANSYFEDASELQYPHAMYQLGASYEEGLGCRQDIATAYNYYLKAGELGLPAALCKLGYFYEFGKHVTSDEKIAYRFYKMAADSALVEGKFAVASCYTRGYGTKKNISLAINIFQDLANQGHEESKCALATLFLAGESVQMDTLTAISITQKGYELGSANAMFTLADCYYKGVGVKQDYQKAVMLYSEHFESTKLDCSASALGDCYFYGRGVEVDYDKAYEYYNFASSKGNVYAQEMLSGHYSGKELIRGNTTNFKSADVWKYIDRIERNLVTEKTKDEVFESPTSLIVDKKWLFNEFYSEGSEYKCFGRAYNSGYFIFHKNGTYTSVRQLRVKHYLEEPNGDVWQVVVKGKWMRHKNEYFCIEPDPASVNVKCVKYEGTLYKDLSARLKSNANDKISYYTEEIKEKLYKQTDHSKPSLFVSIDYPNTWPISKCDRLDKYFLVWGKMTYVNEKYFNEIYIKGIK